MAICLFSYIVGGNYFTYSLYLI